MLSKLLAMLRAAQDSYRACSQSVFAAACLYCVQFHTESLWFSVQCVLVVVKTLIMNQIHLILGRGSWENFVVAIE